MTPVGERIQADGAAREVRIALLAAGVFVGLRLLVVLAILLRGPGDASALFVLEQVVALLLSGALTIGLYQKRFGAAVGLLVLWAVSFAYSWALSGRLLPPLGLIGVLIGAGLFQGVRGTHAYRALARQSAPAV